MDFFHFSDRIQICVLVVGKDEYHFGYGQYLEYCRIGYIVDQCLVVLISQIIDSFGIVVNYENRLVVVYQFFEDVVAAASASEDHILDSIG